MLCGRMDWPYDWDGNLMKADCAILLLTYSGVIETFSQMGNIPLRDAFDKFYQSQIYLEMRDGVSDLHCRSEKYLAEDLMQEYGMGDN